MENYPANSQNIQAKGSVSKTTDKVKSEKKIEQVTVNEVTRRKKPLGKRFAETFGGGDAQGVWVYVVADVLLPAFKDMLADAVSQGTEKLIFGEARAPRPRGSSNRGTGGATHVSYNRYSVKPGHRQDPQQTMTQRGRATHNFDEIILGSRAEADGVLENLFNLVNEYDVATVSDLYEMIGQTADFPDERWGWTDMRSSSVSRVKGGYLLDLPRPVYID